ncbi:MAG: hypothetical protein M3Q23_13450 [Actinomycetota bacterium]|nr:hypothetical protein [Actinomycetota bacterium]
MSVVDVRSPAGSAPSTSKPRRVAFTVLSLILAAGTFGGLLGIGLFYGWFDSEAGGIHRVHIVGFGILFGILSTVPAVALARRPEAKPSAFLQIVAIAVATLLSALVSLEAGYLLFGLIVAAGAAVLLALHPNRAGVLHPSPDPSRIMAAFALGGAVPLVWFGLAMARLQRDGVPADPHVRNDHWANMAALAFALVLVGLLASARVRGWRLTAWCAGIGAAVYGLASIVFSRFPGTQVPYPGSEGVGWGLVALVGGLGFIAVAEWEARQGSDAAEEAPGDVPGG